MAVVGVALNHTVVNLYAGDTAALAATIFPGDAANRNVSWTTSNAGVAGVNQQGVVTGNSPGTAVITVTTADGGFTAQSTVNVSAVPVPHIPVTSISMVPRSIDCGRTFNLLNWSTSEYRLVPTANPENATNRNIIWSVVNSGEVGASISGNTLTVGSSPHVWVPDPWMEEGGFYRVTDGSTITLRATVVDGIAPGINFTQDFIIYVWDRWNTGNWRYGWFD